MSRVLAALAVVVLIAAVPLASLAQTVLFESDFESPLYSLGPVGDSLGAPNSGQDGWRALPRAPFTTAPSPWVLVSNARATSGSRSLQLVMDDTYFNGVNAQGVSATRDLSSQPITLNSPTDPFSVSMNLYLDAAPTTDLSWSLSLLSGGCCGLGMAFLPGNQVRYAHNLMNQSALYTPGFSLFNTWLRVVIERDPTDYTALRLSIGSGNQLWQQQVSSPGASMAFVTFGAIMPTFPTAFSRGTAYVDDVRIGYNLNAIPEPGTAVLAMVGLGILAASRRRG